MAREQSPKTRPPIDAIGIVGQGRLSFALTDHLIYMHAYELGIPMMPAWGPIWARAVHEKIELALERQPKYLLFFDGDGAWSMDDILELHRIVEHEQVDGRPIDAVFPVQADRTHNRPLTFNFRYRRPDDPVADARFRAIYPDRDYSTPFTPVIHGHFGLTFVRAEALRAVGMPWFMDVPGANGSYQISTPGHRDADTYFWLKLHEHGRTVVQANQVVVGHIELTVRWQQGPRVVCQPILDFTMNGKPQNLRAPLVEEMVDDHAPPVDVEDVREEVARG